MANTRKSMRKIRHVLKLAREAGLRTMFEHGVMLATQGVTTVQELLRVTRLTHR